MSIAQSLVYVLHFSSSSSSRRCCFFSGVWHNTWNYVSNKNKWMRFRIQTWCFSYHHTFNEIATQQNNYLSFRFDVFLSNRTGKFWLPARFTVKCIVARKLCDDRQQFSTIVPFTLKKTRDFLCFHIKYEMMSMPKFFVWLDYWLTWEQYIYFSNWKLSRSFSPAFSRPATNCASLSAIFSFNTDFHFRKC